MAQKKILVFLIPISIYAQDLDFDGVEDKFDKCPNSNFSDIVEKDGCKVENINREWNINLLYGNTYFQDSFSHFFQSDIQYKSISAGILIYQDEIDYTFSYSINWEKYILSITSETNFNQNYSISSDLTYMYSNNFTIFGGYIYSSFDISKYKYFISKSDTFFGGLSQRFGKHNFSISYSNSSPFQKESTNIQFISSSYNVQLLDWIFSFSTTQNIVDSEIFYSSSVGFQY